MSEFYWRQSEHDSSVTMLRMHGVDWNWAYVLREGAKFVVCVWGPGMRDPRATFNPHSETFTDIEQAKEVAQALVLLEGGYLARP